MFRFIFGGQIAPVFDSVTFIKGDITLITNEYVNWHKEDTEIAFKSVEASKSLLPIIESIFPIGNWRKRLFIPTKSNWVAFLDSNIISGGASQMSILAKKMGDAEVIMVKALYKYYGHEVNGWGGGWFNYYRGFTPIRYVGLLYQDKWEFEQHGEPLPFEDLEKYKERLTRNKFTPQMLDSYLKHFGIDAFNENFYMPEGSNAYLIEMQRPLYANEKELTLVEARKELRYD